MAIKIIIFDEATSSLDTESEQAIQKNLNAILKEKTAIIIAHRLSTVRNADIIIVLDNGEIGQIYVEGPNLMTGYLNNPQANEKSLSKYGFATGDFGYLDHEGDLYIKGRDDDIFKVGGEKVSVKMIEDAIFGAEELTEFMVVPEYDEHLGNIPCLYYVLKDAAQFNRKLLLSKLRKILPHTHIPAKFTEVDKLPRTSSGKIIRRRPKV